MEHSEFSTLAAFRLKNRALRKYCHTYHVTITPVGKNKSHRTLIQEFLPAIKIYKSVQSVFLIAEVENTNHFHGIVYTKDKCDFSKLYTKKYKNHMFTLHMSEMTLPVWVGYILKRQYTTGFYTQYIRPQKFDIMGRKVR